MNVSITAVDVARDPVISQEIVVKNLPPIKYILTMNPGALGVYLAFIMFVSACQASDCDALMEFLELMDFMEGVPPAVTRTAQ